MECCDITFENVHEYAEDLYEILDKKVLEALMLELEAQIRFSKKES